MGLVANICIYVYVRKDGKYMPVYILKIPEVFLPKTGHYIPLTDRNVS